MSPVILLFQALLAIEILFGETAIIKMKKNIDDTSGGLKCGYPACPNTVQNMLNVHLVPHTHDDVGWLKTVDQYFYGSRDDIQRAGVQYILDTVIEELVKDPKRRFIYVEMAFFSRWWNQQSMAMKSVVRNLVNEGRLQFILGGWSMNDEATTHYNAIIDQQTLGLNFLRKEFGECGRPLISWQIDPFGHSREQASLFAQMGFDALYFARIDYQDYANRINKKTLEFMWKGSDDMPSDLFTGKFFNDYGPPAGFCFDAECDDEPIMDDKTLHDYNVDKRVDDFINAVSDRAKAFSTNHIMLTMGSDFQFRNAAQWFKNLDKLIYYVNERQKNGSLINAFYSNPACYTLALNKVGQTYSTKSDDFFPYAHKPHAFWTGYFTSRPALKFYVRQSNNLLQICKQLSVLTTTSFDAEIQSEIDIFRRVMGVLQHHDAVSGTEKQAVAYDYAMRLSEGTAACQNVIRQTLPLLGSTFSTLNNRNKLPNLEAVQFCALTNISLCDFTEQWDEKTPILIKVYNPLAQRQIFYPRFPVKGQYYVVQEKGGSVVSSQTLSITNDTKRIPERGNNLKNMYELVFQSDLPALGYIVYQISKSDRTFPGASTFSPAVLITNSVFFNNQKLNVLINDQGVVSIANLLDGVTANVLQQAAYYLGFLGSNDTPDLEPSGAYIFRPLNDSPKRLLKSDVYFATGPIVNETYVSYAEDASSTSASNAWAWQKMSLYNASEHVQLEWTVGPMTEVYNPSTKLNYSKEAIMIFESDLKPDEFFTDANGRQLLKRKNNFRESWNFNQTENVAGNYYPINSLIYIKENRRAFGVLNDRAQGGGVIVPGAVEFMVHRRNMQDDNLGVGEPLREVGADGQGLVVRGNHHVWVSSPQRAAQLYRRRALELYMQPLLAFSHAEHLANKVAPASRYSALLRPLPDNVHLLTLEKWDDDSKLLRLEHIYQNGEDAVLSQSVFVDFENLFKEFKVTNAVELSLGANQNVEDVKRLNWNYKLNSNNMLFKSNKKLNSTRVLLKPMEIRTFRIQIQYYAKV